MATLKYSCSIETGLNLSCSLVLLFQLVQTGFTEQPFVDSPKSSTKNGEQFLNELRCNNDERSLCPSDLYEQMSLEEDFFSNEEDLNGDTTSDVVRSKFSTFQL